VAGDGLDQAASYFPQLTDMDLSGPTSLTYTTPPLQQPVNTVGPVGFDLYAASSQPFTDLVAVIADVWPDGTAYPVTTGWLRTLYPDVDPAQSMTDPAGEIVDPYNEFGSFDPALPGTTREYHIEILPSATTSPPATASGSTSSAPRAICRARRRVSIPCPWEA